MFYFLFDGSEWRVRFNHNLEAEGEIKRTNGKRAYYHGTTVALVEVADGVDEKGKKRWKIACQGFAYRSVSDPNFSRRAGRQKSLARLGRELEDKEFKRAIFSAVYN